MIKMIQLLACEGVRWRISPFYSMQARKMNQALGAARQCNHRFESFLFSFFSVHHKKLMKYSETSELCSVPSTSTHNRSPLARRTTFFHRRDVFSSFWPARLLHNRNWTRFPSSVLVAAPLPRVSDWVCGLLPCSQRRSCRRLFLASLEFFFFSLAWGSPTQLAVTQNKSGKLSILLHPRWCPLAAAWRAIGERRWILPGFWDSSHGHNIIKSNQKLVFFILDLKSSTEFFGWKIT